MRQLRLFWKRLTGLRRDESGVVMLETVLVFPIQLMVIMVIIQIAHIYVAANVLHYAAFQGVRTAAVNLRGGNADTANTRGQHVAWAIASVINNEGGGAKRMRVPGNNYVFPAYDPTGVAQMQMEIETSADPDRRTQGSLGYWLELVVPVGGPLIYHVMKEGGHPVAVNPENRRGRIYMTQNARFFKPWPH